MAQIEQPTEWRLILTSEEMRLILRSLRNTVRDVGEMARAHDLADELTLKRTHLVENQLKELKKHSDKVGR